MVLSLLSYSVSSSSADEELLTASIIGGVIGGLVGLALGIVMLVAEFKIFAKAGKPGWHAIIPFLSSYDLFEIAWGNGILFLLTLIPLVNVVVSFMLYFKLARAFGKDGGFALGLIFFPYIFLLMLGFGDACYVGPDGVPQNGAYPGAYPGAYQQPYQQPYQQQPYQQQPYQQQPYQQQPYQQQPYQQQPYQQQPYQQQPYQQQPYQQQPYQQQNDWQQNGWQQ